MGEWTSLLNVQDSRQKDIDTKFTPALVWIVNFVSQSVNPMKFMYPSCPQRLDSGRLCGKSTEFGQRCDHNLPGQPAFKFQLILQDATHAGSPPLHVPIWETASVFLGCSAKHFATFSEIEQINYMLALTQTTPKAEVQLFVKDFEVKIQWLTLLGSRPRIPFAVPADIGSAPQMNVRSPLANKGTSHSTSSTSKTIIVEGLQEIIRKLDYVDLDLDRMPRVSKRQRQLRFIKEKLDLNILLCNSSSDDGSNSEKSSDDFNPPVDSGTDMDILDSSTDSGVGGDLLELEGQPGDLLDMLCIMDGTRYFVDREVTAKSRDFALNYFASLPDNLFRQMARMDKRTFFPLLDLVEQHPIFMNRSTFQQAPVVWQLTVTLDRLGHNGNGACLNHMVLTWGVSNGSLINFTYRCFAALDEVPYDQVKWPNSRERRAISEEFGKRGFPGCVGLVDGSLIPLSQRPKEGGECYYDRKCRYNINAQVVCDHRRKILYMYTDLTCFKRSRLWRKMENAEFFSRGQYILGDSGYQNAPAMVSAFKNTSNSPEKEAFNFCVAKCRVTNEHCIGVLKSRWFSLRELRVQLKSGKDNLWAIKWLGICAKLHNFVISRNDLWREEDDPIQGDEGEVIDVEEFSATLPQVNTNCISQPRNVGRTRPGAVLFAQVMAYALQFHKQPGGFLEE